MRANVRRDAGMTWFMSFGYLIMFFLFLPHLPVRAEITVTDANGSSPDINYQYLDGGESGMDSSMNFVPGNRISMNGGNASVLIKNESRLQKQIFPTELFFF